MDTREPANLEAIRRVAAGKVDEARQRLDTLRDRVQAAAQRPDLLARAELVRCAARVASVRTAACSSCGLTASTQTSASCTATSFSAWSRTRG